MRIHIRPIMIWLAVLLNSLSLLAAAPADIIITHARIYTLNPAKPWAEAVAVRGGNVVAVGSAKSVLLARGPKTRVIDAGGRLLLPGFTDSHTHFMDGSLSGTKARLDETNNVAEIRKVLKDFAAAHPVKPGESPWLLGRGWNYSEFGNERLPNKKDLDDLFPDRPVFLESYDLHSVWVNSVALKLAGITKDTPDPHNGKIVRDANGEATGALQEEGYNMMARVVPPASFEQHLTALRAAMREANRLGITRVINCGNDTPNSSDELFAGEYEHLHQHGELTVRFVLSNYLAPERPAETLLAEAEALRKRFPTNDPWLAAGAVKFFLDGAIEVHTGAMLTPYSDDPSTKGVYRWDASTYKALVTDLDRRGFQIYSHAVGEGAVRQALDTYEAVSKANHTSDRRHRIEHIETIAVSDIPRFASTGTIASMQPLHAYPGEDTNVWLKSVGPERATRAWAWGSIGRHGGHLAFGSDWPVVTLNPWEGIESAVTRQTQDGQPPEGFNPGERLTVAQAIDGYTRGGAFAGHHEKTEGSIEVGKVADMILLSQDLFLILPHEIHKTEVLMTMVGGKVVYTSPDFQVSPAKAGPTKGN
jgi:predicted amidohydrolase YtcJ